MLLQNAHGKVGTEVKDTVMKHILIVEDNQDLLDIFARTFDSLGFQVRLAADGQEAIDCLDEMLPDIILLDINMPRLSGFDVLTHVRAHKETHQVKVIVVTGNMIAMRDEKAEFADLFLVKPVDVRDLITLATRLLD